MKTYMVVKIEKFNYLVAQTATHPDRMYWFGGVSYAYFNPSVQILHTLGTTDDPDVEDAFEIEYWREWNPPAVTPISLNGWLAPDGKWYGCEFGAHDGVAKQISAALYGILGDSDDLESRCWLRVQDGMVVTVREFQATQSQIDILGEIVQMLDSDYARRRSLRFIASAVILTMQDDMP